jgi:Ca2+-binding RTX toxin-like protein
VPLAVAVWAQPAAGSTLKVGAEELTYLAAPGEVNQVSIRSGRKGVEISDAGAAIAAPGCKRIDEHRVTCEFGPFVDVRTGDGEDSVAIGSDAGGDVEIASVDLGPGADRVDVAAGVADTYLRGGPGADVLNGGPSPSDTIDYGDATAPVHVDLNAATSGVAGEDRIASIEGAIGGHGRDTLIGTAADNQLIGGPGGDLLDGGSGFDQMDGERGNDTLFGGRGTDEMTGGAGRDLLLGGDGDDLIDASDAVKGRDSADMVGCGAGSDFVGGQRPRHARVRDADLLTTDCEELRIGRLASVLIPRSPLSGRALALGFRYDFPPRAGIPTRVLAKDGPRFLAGGHSRIGRRGTVRARLSPEGRQFAARRIAAPALIRVRAGSRTTAFRLLLPPPRP